MDLQKKFNEVEELAGSIRQDNKDAYLSSKEMTEGDYIGSLENVPITFDTYQIGTKWTAEYPKSMPTEIYCAVGLAEEVGELISHIKKLHRDNEGILLEERKNKIIGEASDVLYYFSALLLSLGIKLSTVADFNQKKLVKRLKKGKIKGSGSDR